jgi:hypothetical protein
VALGPKIGDVYLRAAKSRVHAYWRPTDGTPEVLLCSMAQSIYKASPAARELFVKLATAASRECLPAQFRFAS